MGKKIRLLLLGATLILIVATCIQYYLTKKHWEHMYIEYCDDPTIHSAEEYRADFNRRMNEWCRQNGHPESF